MYTAAVVGVKPPFGRVANLMKLTDQIKVVAVCDLKKEWADECAAKFAIPKAFGDFRDMLKEPFDIFVSFTGTYSRPEQVIAAAQAGRQIYTEKPLTLSIEEGRKMLDAVRQAKVKYQIGYQLRTYYFARAMKALIDKGVLGTIGTCMSRRFMPAEHWKGPGGKPTWYGRQELSGGITVDYTTHDIDLLRWWLGDIKTVYANIRRSRCQTSDDNVWANLQFGNGAMGMIGASFSATFGSCDIMVAGDKGSARVVDYRDVMVKLWGVEEKPASAYVDVTPDPEDVTRVQFENLAAALRDNREPSPNIEDGFRAVEVAVAMQRSSQTGKPVELPLG
ncbi:MAG: hypothetical protein A3K19_30490 [Lentisphaerae bacterium RIFOXYB12_FULL_65_16]|nr:MAG: hypothetical protein A3K18_18250 [Lentisphaerae bacterium RIFOXYA12_64_32]OGV85790.1 MAG: hypothetical protein A3K19_30490 [Lentisphaerae bacterium RIFOXYB12_FULL_65_16]